MGSNNNVDNSNHEINEKDMKKEEINSLPTSAHENISNHKVDAGFDENKNDNDSLTVSKKQTFLFGMGAFTDQMSHQAFQFLVFTFYYAVIGINVKILAIGFIIFAIWDSINDPLIGYASDKTQSKFGRRRFWILIGLIPFGLVNMFLFIVPSGSETLKAVYMILIIMAYDLFYTIFSANQTALFPEMFPTEKARAKANMYKNMMTVIGVLIGFVLPTLLISPLAPTTAEEVPLVTSMYRNTGIFIGALTIILGFIFFKFGMVEPENPNFEESMGVFHALKEVLKNKAFMIFVIANMFNWFVFKLMTTIIPLYAVHVLGIGEGNFLISVLLLVGLLSAMLFFPVMQKMGLKFGMRKAFMISNTIWIITLIPFAFFDNQPYLAIVGMFFMGFGLSGTMYYVDIIIGNIIDEDELKSGQRRSGTFYGVNALINRYSTILVVLAIAGVLTGYGWDQYLVGASVEQSAQLVKGLKLLLVGFNIMGILIVLLLLKFFPLHGARLKEVKEAIEKRRHDEKNKSV